MLPVETHFQVKDNIKGLATDITKPIAMVGTMITSIIMFVHLFLFYMHTLPTINTKNYIV